MTEQKGPDGEKEHPDDALADALLPGTDNETGDVAPADPPANAVISPPGTGAKPARANPARKVGLILIILLAVLVGWYAAADRLAPSTGRGVVNAYVAQVAPRVAGQVTEVFVQDNQFVEAGEPLFRLDQRPFELAMRQAEAGLAQAAQATEVSAAQVSTAQAGVSQASVALENARVSYNRTRSLSDRGVTSQAQVDAATAELRNAEARLEQAELQLLAAMAQLGGENGAPNPNVLAAQLQLEQAQLDLIYSTVVAPTRGVVTNLRVAIGQFAGAGAEVMTFIDARGAWITADLRENQIGRVEEGKAVGILFDAMPGRIYTGRVHSIAWGIDPGRTTAGGLMQNEPENRWFEPARRMPVNIELDGGVEHWPVKVRAGGKVHVVVYAGGENTPVAWVASALQRIQSWLTYLY